MPTSPAAETMPGGAPLKSSRKRPCKYGPRDAEGHCPKKQRTSSGTSSGSSGGSRKRASKRPCKYGPRDENGLCPKKPKTPRAQRAPSVRDYESVSAASRQAGQVLRSKKATSEQKKEAVKVLGSAVAGEVGKKVAEHTYREAKKAVRTPEGRAALKQGAQIAKKVGKGTLVGVAIGTTLHYGGKVLDAQREKEAKAWARQQLAATKQRLGKQKLTAAQEATLLKQYEDHFKKRPVTNPYTGK